MFTIDKLQPKIDKAANMIRQAAEDNRLIVLRHHGDADGYCGALAIEEVIVPIIQKNNSRTWQKFKRLPMRTPFYDYMDALKDIVYLKEESSYGRKPLLIIVDNGSGDEDLLALKRIMLHDVEIIILDHHIYSEEVDKLVDLHVNPRTEGGEGDVCGGILGYEVANKIGKARPIFAAVAGIADKSKDKFVEPYIKLVGENREFLKKLASCVDFEAYNLKFGDSSPIYDLFNENQKKIVNLLWPELEKRIKEYTTVVKKYFKEEKLSKGSLCTLDMEKTVLLGNYPTTGKIIGIAHRTISGPRISLGFGDSFVTFRVDGVEFSITELMSAMKTKLPHGLISGGGHDYAGTVKFISAVKNEAHKIAVDYAKSKLS
ncbi:MAG: hypothetical protein ABIB43_03685 [archaeon]